MIINNKKRDHLLEGRNFGFGFAILEKIEDGVYETVSAFSACKDYLNDIVYIETHNKKLPEIFGLNYEYAGLLDKSDRLYLGICALHYKNGVRWSKFDDLEDKLLNNHQNLIRLLNKLEEKFQIDDRTHFEHFENGTLILSVPKFWAKYHFLISLYTLYIRVFVDVSESELEFDLETINKHSPYLIEDKTLFDFSKKWIESKYFEKLLDFKYPNTIPSPISTIHNSGIQHRLQQIDILYGKTK